MEKLTQVETLRELRAWLKFSLERTYHRTSQDRWGQTCNSWSVVEIPDWDVRQKLDMIEEALSQ